MLDLVVGPCRVVTGSGRQRAYIGIAGGRVAALTAEPLPARTRLDGEELVAMPGMVDEHVHFMDPGETDREDFIQGSRAAAVGGVTTVIEHTHSHPVRSVEALEAKADYVSGRSLVDFGLAAHCWPEDIGSGLEALWRAGAAFFKIFTVSTHGVPGLSPDQLLQAFRQLAELGAPALVHCEEPSMVSGNAARLKAAGRTDPALLNEWRTPEAEQAAALTVAHLAALTGARVTIAHVSHPAVARLVRAVSGPTGVRLETCPQYLLLDRDEVATQGALRKFTPPARARRDAEGLLALLQAGALDAVATDHAPATRAQKAAGSIWDAPFGLPGIETTLPVLCDLVHRGALTFEQVVRLYAEGPARFWGFYPAKGTIAVGSDADLVLVDPDARWTIRDDQVVSKAGWSPFAGRTLVGRPVYTLVRGEVVARHGEPVGIPGHGRWVVPHRGGQGG